MKKRKKKRAPKRRRNDRGLFITRHPFADLDRAVVQEAIINMAQKQHSAFPDHLTALLGVIKRCYPPHVLSTLAAYGLMSGVSDKGVQEQSLLEIIQQHHVELLQSFVLTLPPEEWGLEAATPSDIQVVIDALRELTDAFHQRRLLKFEHEQDSQIRTVLGLQERIRMHTQIVRNWGYLSDVMAISEELYSPLDDRLRTFHGFGISELIKVAHAQVSLISDRGSERFRRLKRIFRERTIARFVREFFRQYPEMGDPDHYIRRIPPSATVEMVGTQLLAHLDKQLVLMFLISAEELAGVTGIEVAVVDRIISALLLRPGSLVDYDPEQLFLDNPVWTAPVIAMGDEYFCPIPMDVFSFIHDIARKLIEVAGLKSALEERRAKYLEEKASKLLERALPKVNILRNANWRVAGADYETDLIARFDTVVVIVEAKSAVLTKPALRGAPERVKRHIQELIINPSKQSSRLEGLIWQAVDGNLDAISVLSQIGVDFKGVQHVIRVSVTLDDFSVLSSSEGKLKEAGWIPQNLEVAPTIGIADLSCVVQILDRPQVFLHYLLERHRFQKTVDLVSDELDLLGFYLVTGFNVSPIEQSGATLTMTGMSLAVDKYFNSRDIGIYLPKPVLRLSPYFSALINAIQLRAFPGWISVALDLLRAASHQEQVRIEEALEVLRQEVKRTWRDPDHRCAVVVETPQIRDAVIVFYVFPPQHAQSRHDIANKIAAQALEQTSKKRCVLVARDTAGWKDVAYSFLYVATRPALAES